MKIIWNYNFCAHEVLLENSPTHLHIHYGCFHNTIADMSSLNRESMTSKAKDLLFDPLQKTFPKPYCRVWLTIIF